MSSRRRAGGEVTEEFAERYGPWALVLGRRRRVWAKDTMSGWAEVAAAGGLGFPCRTVRTG